MWKAVLALAAAAAVAGCNRQSTHEPRTGGAAGAPADDTWVAQPTDLSEEQVRLVQRALTSRGFQVDASGTFDAATQTALADFQRSRGLPATGNLSADTASALGIPPEDVRPPRDMTADERRDGASDAANRPGQPPTSVEPRTAPSTSPGSTAADR